MITPRTPLWWLHSDASFIGDLRVRYNFRWYLLLSGTTYFCSFDTALWEAKCWTALECRSQKSPRWTISIWMEGLPALLFGDIVIYFVDTQNPIKSLNRWPSEATNRQWHDAQMFGKHRLCPTLATNRTSICQALSTARWRAIIKVTVKQQFLMMWHAGVTHRVDLDWLKECIWKAQVSSDKRSLEGADWWYSVRQLSLPM